MKVQLKLFAQARDIAGADVVELELKDDATVGNLREELCNRFPRMSPLAANLLVAMNNEYVTDATPVASDAEIACFPPVSGG